MEISINVRVTMHEAENRLTASPSRMVTLPRMTYLGQLR